jgi:hypothetical protein|tara:strand:- start:1134 stop:1523 length:390 start_codon:yes stop_codon:yes gene_type:complete
MKFIKKFSYNMKNILIYSDSELLELAICSVLLFINPGRALHIPPMWCLLGITAALAILFGLGYKSLRIREVGLLLALVNLTAINFMHFQHSAMETTYVVQNIIVVYAWWKIGKQRLTKSLRKGCGHGTQ